MTIEELIAAYQAGEVTEPIWLDNDDTYAYAGDNQASRMHPRELLEALLRHVGIPVQSA